MRGRRESKVQAYLDEESLFSNTPTAKVDIGTILLARLDVRHDTLGRSHKVTSLNEWEWVNVRRTGFGRPVVPGWSPWRRDRRP